MTLHDWFLHKQPQPVLTVDQWRNLATENINNSALLISCMQMQTNPEIVKECQAIYFKATQVYDHIQFFKYVPLSDMAPYWESLKKTVKPHNVWSELRGILDQIGVQRLPVKVVADYISYLPHIKTSDPYQLLSVIRHLSDLKLSCPDLPALTVQESLEKYMDKFSYATPLPKNMVEFFSALEATFVDWDRERFGLFIKASRFATYCNLNNESEALQNIADVFLVQGQSTKDKQALARSLLYDYFKKESKDQRFISKETISKKIDVLLPYLEKTERHAYLKATAEALENTNNAFLVQWPGLVKKIREFSDESDLISVRDGLNVRKLAYLWCMQVRLTDEDLKAFEHKFPGFNTSGFNEERLHPLNFKMFNRQTMSLRGITLETNKTTPITCSFVKHLAQRLLKEHLSIKSSIEETMMYIRQMAQFIISPELPPNINKEAICYILSCMAVHNTSNPRKHNAAILAVSSFLKTEVPWVLQRKTVPVGDNDMIRVLGLIYGQKDLQRMAPMLDLLGLNEAKTWDSALSNIKTLLDSFPHPVLNPTLLDTGSKATTEPVSPGHEMSLF